MRQHSPVNHVKQQTLQQRLETAVTAVVPESGCRVCWNARLNSNRHKRGSLPVLAAPVQLKNALRKTR